MSNVTITPTVGAPAFTGKTVGNNPSSAFFYLSEYKTLLERPTSGSAYPRPALVDQTLAYGTFAGLSAPFSADTRIVRLQATGTCAVKIGTQPVALSNPQGTTRMIANQTEFYVVEPGHLLSVVIST